LGEAFFEVKKNKEVPFIINAGNIQVEVVGTSFNVNSFNNKSEVIVKTGVVKVRTKSNSNSWILNAGSRIVIDRKNNVIEKEQNTNLNYLAWKTKVYIFEKTKMSEVFELIEKDYNTKIELADSDLNNCTLYAVIENKSLSDILDIIKHTFGIEYSIEKGKIIIKGKGC
jgi:ferric-dicitrate binding protein FerR (iron transport regulator)